MKFLIFRRYGTVQLIKQHGIQKGHIGLCKVLIPFCATSLALCHHLLYTKVKLEGPVYLLHHISGAVT